MSADPTPAEFTKLQKVLDLRVARAKRLYLDKRAHYNELLAEANSLQDAVDTLTNDYKELVDQLAVDNGNSGVETLVDISNRRYWLNYDLELQQYYLDIALDDVAEAAKELAVLKKLWMDAEARDQAVDDMRGAAENRAVLNDEIQTEIEQADGLSSRGCRRG